MPNGVTIVFGGDDAGMIQAFQAVLKEQAKAEAATKKMNAAYRETAKEAAGLEREAKKIFEGTRTPMEEYTGRLKRLEELHKAGKISTETHRRAAVEAMDRLAKQSRVLSAEEEEAAQKKQALIDEARRKQEELGRSGQRVWDQTRTPLERYNAKLLDLNRLVQKGAIDQETFRRATQRAKDELDRAGEAGQKAFGPQALSMLSRFGTALGITGGVAGAVALVRKEYQSLIETQKEAGRLSVGAAGAESAALANLAPETTQERESYLKQARAIARRRGVPLSAVHMRAADALSARGEGSVADAMRAVELSLQYSPSDEAAGKAAAGAALDIARAGKVTDVQALGFLQDVGVKARVTDPRKVAENIAPVIAAAVANQGDLQTGGALWATLTQAGVDVRGEKSRTAIQSFARQLSQALPDVKTLDERIRYMQSHAAQREEFLGKMSLEMFAKTPMEALLRGGKEAQVYEQFRRDLPTPEEAETRFRRRLAVREASALQQTAHLSRALEGTIEGLAVANQTTARLGVIKEKFGALLKQTGMGATASMLSELGTEARGGGIADFRRQLEAREKDILERSGDWEGWSYRRRPHTAAVPGHYNADWSYTPGTPPKPIPSDVDREQAAVLRSLIEVLREIERNTSESTALQRDAQRRPDPALSHSDHE